jgi:hypothetical protein
MAPAENKPEGPKNMDTSSTAKEANESDRPDGQSSKEAATLQEERKVAAEVVYDAQAQNEQQAAQAESVVEHAAAENVGQLLNNMEAGLGDAPPEESAEHIIGRTTEETAGALGGEEALDAEMVPLDWPEHQPEASAMQGPDGVQATGPFEASNILPRQPERFDRRMYDEEPDQPSSGAPYIAAGSGGVGGGGQPPAGAVSGFNPNAMPPLGAAAPAAANLAAARAEGAADGLVRGFLTGLIGGGIIGHWLGHRHERTKAARAMTKQEQLHTEQVAKYEQQVAASEARIRTLTERQAYAARQAMQAAAEATPAIKYPEAAGGQPRGHESVPSSAAVADNRAEVKTDMPKRVEQMTDTEIHEASRHVKIGDKTLYELKENGTVTAVEERTLLRLAEQGGIEDPARKYRFDQEVRHVLMRHELDPVLAQQVLQQNDVAQASEGGSAATAQQHSPLFEQEPIAPLITMPATSVQATQPAARGHAPRQLVMANIIAGCILVGLLLVLIVISITR